MAGAGLYEVGSGKTYATIQLALDALWTDQGAAQFTATQYIRVFAGTYTEDVVPNAGLAPDWDHGKLLILEGDPADDRDNVILQAAAGECVDASCIQIWVRHMKLLGTGASRALFTRASCLNSHVSDCRIESSGAYDVYLYHGGVIENCEIVHGSGDVAVFGVRGMLVRRTLIVLSNANGTAVTSNVSMVLDAVTIDGGLHAVEFQAFYEKWRPLLVRNCTFYNVTNGIHFIGGDVANAEVVNTIFKDVDYPYRSSVAGEWPQESGGHVGPGFVQRNNCYHGYTAYAYDGTTTKTAAEWAAFNQVDVAGELDATDPLLTAPGTDDFSLQAASPCRHAGHGSGVVYDVEGTAYDKYHPDIGAMSTGTLTVTAPSITAAVDDESGTTATLTLNADNALDVLTVRYRKTPGTAEWTTFGSTRTGDGDLQITGLEVWGYEFIAHATRGGVTSLASNPAFVRVSTGVLPLEKSFWRLLLSLSDVTDLVGDRITAMPASQTVASPYIVYSVVTDASEDHMTGGSGFSEARIQVDSYADTYEGAKAVANALRENLHGYDSTVTWGSDSNPMQVRLTSSQDGPYDPDPGAEIGPFRVSQDYWVQHGKTVPSP